MAPNLAVSQHELIRDMILNKSLIPGIAEAAGCSERSIRAIRSNFRYFDTIKISPNGVGRPRNIILPILTVFYKHFLEKPKLY
jgi:hypothetical protein